MNNLEKAKKLLKDGGYTCVLCGRDRVKTSCERGVGPLMECIESEYNYCEFSAADKVVGKGAAFLYAILGIKRVYANVISRGALCVFEKYGIEAEYETVVDSIVNRSGTGLCPMEQATRGIEDKEEALVKIRDKLKELKRR